MNIPLVSASIVDNSIAATTVQQFYFFDCEDMDCRMWLEEMITSDSLNGQNSSASISEIITETVNEEPSAIDVSAGNTAVVNLVPAVFHSVRINEIVSAVETGEKEWVELYNNSTGVINLKDWFIEEGGGTKTILAGEIEAAGYLVFETKNLNNSGDIIYLKDSTGQIIDQVVYGDWNDGSPVDNFLASGKGESLSLINDSYVINPNITKGAINRYEQLTVVSDPVNEANVIVEKQTTSLPPDIVETEIAVDAGAALPITLDPPIPYQFSDDILINEFLPAPDNSEEWIELYNQGEVDVDLRGWSIDDAVGGSAPYIIAESLVIKSKGYLVLSQSQTKVQLNNSSDEVRLLDPEQRVIDSVSYVGSHVNTSWSKIDTSWRETELISPGVANAERLINEIQTMVVSTETEENNASYKSVTVSEICALDLRTQIKVEAAVTVLPGTFSKNTIYVQDETGGVQVYFESATWPELALGREVIVTGTVSQSLGERRIVIKNDADIFVKQSLALIAPFKINSSLLSPVLVGNLVELEATLFEKDGNTLFMTDDGGGMKVYLKKGAQISSSLFEVNDKLKIVGVLVLNNGEYLLQPRAEADIVKIDSQVPVELSNGEALSAGIVSSDNSGDIFKLLGVATIVLAVINVGLLMLKRVNKRKLKSLWYRFRGFAEN